jgi:hypothetical protein
MDSRFPSINSIQTNQGVNLKVRKMQVDVDRIQTNEEISERFLLFDWDVFEEGGFDGGPRGEGGTEEEVEFEGFGVDIADFDTSFVGEENRITLTRGVDADVIFSVRGVGEEWLDDEVVQRSGDRFYLKDIHFR